MGCGPPGSSVRGDSPGKNTGVGCHALLRVIFPTRGLNPGLPHCRQILYHLSHQGSPRILEWVAYPFSSGSSLPRNRTRVSCIGGGFFTSWATDDALIVHYSYKILIFPEKDFNFNSLRVEMILDTLGLYFLTKNHPKSFCFCVFDSCNLSLGALPCLVANYRGCVCPHLYLLSILQSFLLDFSSFPSQYPLVPLVKSASRSLSFLQPTTSYLILSFQPLSGYLHKTVLKTHEVIKWISNVAKCIQSSPFIPDLHLPLPNPGCHITSSPSHSGPSSGISDAFLLLIFRADPSLIPISSLFTAF